MGSDLAAKDVSFLGLAVTVGLVVQPADAEAQTAGMERCHERRQGRVERALSAARRRKKLAKSVNYKPADASPTRANTVVKLRAPKPASIVEVK
jgi:hypothetical protein